MTNQGSDPRPKLSIDAARREERGSSGGRWVAILDGHEAEMTYSRASAVLIIIDHTAVPDALRGRGVGQVLVQRAVEDARREGFKILPLCPFAKGQFERSRTAPLVVVRQTVPSPTARRRLRCSRTGGVMCAASRSSTGAWACKRPAVARLPSAY